jgi:hypothetical protein
MSSIPYAYPTARAQKQGGLPMPKLWNGREYGPALQPHQVKATYPIGDYLDMKGRNQVAGGSLKFGGCQACLRGGCESCMLKAREVKEQINAAGGNFWDDVKSGFSKVISPIAPFLDPLVNTFVPGGPLITGARKALLGSGCGTAGNKAAPGKSRWVAFLRE